MSNAERNNARRLPWRALALLGLAALVLSIRGFTTIDRQRAKLVERPTAPIDGAVVWSHDAIRPLIALGQPLALIARVSNTATTTRRIEFFADGEPVCAMPIAASTTARLDCQISMWPAGNASSTLRVASEGAEWSLDYLEIATHHGNTDGLFYTVFLPAASRLGQAPRFGEILTICLIALAVFLWADPAPLWPWARRACSIVAVLVGTIFVVVVASPWVSRYRVVVSDGTTIRLLCLAALPQLVCVWRWLGRAPPPGERPTWLRPALAALCVGFAFATVMQAQLVTRYGGNYSGMLLISRSFFEQNPLMNGRDDVRATLRLIDDGGYDGQFMYYLAFDPLMRRFSHDPHAYRAVVDAVPYRFGRIGYPLLASVLSVGQWRHVPATMWWMLIAATSLGAFCLALQAQYAGLSPALGLLMLFIPGFWQSVQNGLPEPVAGALLLAGACVLSRGRAVAAALCFALALLIRETGVVLVVCLAFGVLWRQGKASALRFVAIAVAPMALWRLYVGWTLWPDWGFKGFFDPSPILGMPFKGFVDLWDIVRVGAYYTGSHEFARAAYAYPALLIFGLVLAVLLTLSRPNAVTIAAVAYGALAVSMNYELIWDHIGNGQRGSFELFIVLGLSLLAGKTYPPRLRYALVGFWIASAWYTMFGAFDAESLRLLAGLPV